METDQYTYAEYLEYWKENFGDSEYGDWEYYNKGEKYVSQLKRLTEREFQQHLSALDAADAEYERARQENSDTGMAHALSVAFPHELVLLL